MAEWQGLADRGDQGSDQIAAFLCSQGIGPGLDHRGVPRRPMVHACIGPGALVLTVQPGAQGSRDTQ